MSASLIVPILIALICAYAVYKKTDLFSALTDGARDGLKTVASILPSLVIKIGRAHV